MKEETKEMEKKPEWDLIFKALDRWQRTTEDLPTPAVSAAAAGAGGEAGGEVKKPWAVLVATILSLRTKDEVTLVSSRALLEAAPTPAAMRALPLAEAARLAYPAGFYRTKAAQLKKIAVLLKEKHGDQVPADMEALLALPGVGRKTANLVLTEAFGLDGVCVDTHVHRICNRAGWVSTRNPEETETALRKNLPRRYWKVINNLLVLYGQRVCRPQSPFCSRCLLTPYCQRRGVGRSR